MKNVVFVHGWGFDASFWEGIASEITGCDIQCVDMGFFGLQNKTLPDDAIYITHSMGLAWTLERANHVEALVVINGFTKFCASTDWPDGVAERMLTRMIRQFDRAPEKVWVEFMKNSGLDAPIYPDEADTNGLKTGLEYLLSVDVRQKYQSLTCPKFILAGGVDTIVTEKLTVASFERDIIWYKEAKHLLPLSHSTDCVRHIQEFLDQLD
ncbi:MAG: hypothetical protein HWE30_06250 [Methylocystaceae bacterium]|nr:hypothetical protein [Methylocystaceae bacterium]